MKSKKKNIIFIPLLLSLFSLYYFLFTSPPLIQATEIDVAPDLMFGKTLQREEISDYPKVVPSPDPDNPDFLLPPAPASKNVKIPAGGATGPDKDKLQFPDLKAENDFYDSEEFKSRVLPQELLDQVKKVQFQSPTPLPGKIAHIGCGQITVNGQDKSEARVVGKSETNFEAPKEFSRSIMLARFWQSIFVPDKGTDLKISLNVQDNKTDVPEYLQDCQNKTKGVDASSSEIKNTEPKTLALLGSILENLSKLIRDLLNPGDSFAVDVKVQQVKYIPGEKQFENESVGKEGFLQFFKPAELKFSKEGDQVELVQYQVLGNEQQENVGYAGVSSFKSGTIDMIKSIYPQEVLDSVGDILTPPSNEAGLTYTIPYRDTSKTITQEKKDAIIKQVTENWPDSPIALYWDTVVQRSLEAKINPAFTLAIWVEESGASSPKAGAWSPFGCFPSRDTNKKVGFSRSLECFIYFTEKEHPSNFEEWASFFCGPAIRPICANNPHFLNNLKIWYDRIAQ